MKIRDAMPQPLLTLIQQNGAFATRWLVGIFLLYKDFSDAATIRDAIAKLTGKLPTDNATLSDVQAKSVVKTVQAWYAIDYFAEQYDTGTDSLGFADLSAKTLQRGKADSASITDGSIKAFDKAPSDTGRLSDLFARVVAFSRLPIDTGAFADLMARSITTGRADGAGIGDSKSLGMNRPATDVMSLSDAGTYRGQSYSDFDYFLENYVGYSGAF